MAYDASEQRLLREFGDRLKAHRSASGLSQEQLAEVSKLHRTYVGSCERGQRNVSLLNIVKMATALNLDVTELIGTDLQTAAQSRRVLKLRISKSRRI